MKTLQDICTSKAAKWKEIVGFEGLYEISDNGFVKSLPHPYSPGESILKPKLTNAGYLFILLRNRGNNKYKTIHRLVAEHFILNEQNFRTVNHKNGVKTDNRVENLEWCSYKYNNLHAIKTGLNKGQTPESIEKTMLHIMKSVVGSNKKDTIIFRSLSDAGRYLETSASAIHYAISHNQKCKNYRWRYA